MNISDFVTSWIRTAVPAAVGFAITWLAGALNVVVDGNTANGVIGFCVLVVTGVYYLLVRALEARVPAFGVLLGVPKQPAYERPITKVDTPMEEI
jgi:hypothetical protein